jgi:hypothetical protein
LTKSLKIQKNARNARKLPSKSYNWPDMLQGVNITKDDQILISEFSKIHMSSKENNAELKFYKEMKELTDNCADELDMEVEEGEPVQ